MFQKRIYPGFLFHGTDKRVLSYSPEQRDNLFEISRNISEFLYQKFVNDGMSVFAPTRYKEKRGKVLGDEWYRFMQAFQHYDAFSKGSKLYEHGNFYLCTTLERAADYARKSYIYGECGYDAYHLFKSACRIWDLVDDADSDELKIIHAFEDICDNKPEPVVLSFKGVLEEDLLTESGKPIDWNTWEELLSARDSVHSLRCASECNIMDYLDQIIPLNQ